MTSSPRTIRTIRSSSAPRSSFKVANHNQTVVSSPHHGESQSDGRAPLSLRDRRRRRAGAGHQPQPDARRQFAHVQPQPDAGPPLRAGLRKSWRAARKCRPWPAARSPGRRAAGDAGGICGSRRWGGWPITARRRGTTRSRRLSTDGPLEIAARALPTDAPETDEPAQRAGNPAQIPGPLRRGRAALPAGARHPRAGAGGGASGARLALPRTSAASSTRGGTPRRGSRGARRSVADARCAPWPRASAGRRRPGRRWRRRSSMPRGSSRRGRGAPGPRRRWQVFERVYGPGHYEIAVNLNNLDRHPPGAGTGGGEPRRSTAAPWRSRTRGWDGPSGHRPDPPQPRHSAGRGGRRRAGGRGGPALSIFSAPDAVTFRADASDGDGAPPYGGLP